MARQRRRMHRRYKRNRGRSEGASSRSNPPAAMEIVEYLAPGFAGFAASRVLTRLVAVQISQRWPGFAKHAGVLASAVSFGAAWWGAHRVKFLEKYATPITVGAGIAALQSVLQLWLPKIGWLVGDPLPAAGMSGTDNLMIDAPSLEQMTAGMQEVNADPSSFTFDESLEAESYAQTPKRPAGPPRTPEARKAKAEEDLLVDLNLDEGMGGGIFAN